MNAIIKSGLLFLSLFLFSTVNAQTKTVKTRVEGNCGMCKDRIESVAKNVAGVKAATWGVDSKILKLTFDSKKTTLKEVLKKIAEAGHDNEAYRASDKVYNNFEVCCQYDRPNHDKRLPKAANLNQVNELK